jgi:hypothetical protein
VKIYWTLILGYGLLLASSASASALHLEVIPQPQQVSAIGQGFAPAKATTLRVSDTAADRFAAEQLRDALRGTHGIDCPIVATTPAAGQHELILSVGDGAVAATAAVVKEHAAEGYALRVDANGVRISAASDAGLYYGVQTLIQLAEQVRRDNGPIPGMEIVDWPTFGWRGRYLEAGQSRGTVLVTRQNLEREIRLLGRFKLNCLISDLYNLVPFRSFPAAADENTLSLADWIYLVELAHRHHVAIIPGLQSFAQIYEVIWTCDAGKPYREETAPGMICPSRPENIQFLQGLYKDLMSVFKYSPYLCVGCSETDMQWQKRYCPRCKARIDAGETYYDIYYKHVNDCVKAVEAAAKQLGRNVRPMMWADEFYVGYNGRRWTGIEKIPKNVVMGHWQYWNNWAACKDYNGIAGLLERGYDVFWVSASFEFNTYLHDLSPEDPKDGRWDALCEESGVANIAAEARWANTYNRKNYPGQVVGGACATFSQHDVRGWDTTWYAYVLQSEYSWGNPTRPLATVKEPFTDAFAAAFYGARDRETAKTIAAGLRDLDAAKSKLEANNTLIRDFIGEYDIHDANYNDNDLVKSLKLIDDLTAKPQGPGKTIQDIRQRAQQAAQVARAYRAKLAALSSRVDNGYSLGYLVLAAQRIENHATRTVYMLDQQALLAKLSAAKTPEAKRQLRGELDGLAQRLALLRVDTRVITDAMDQLSYGSVSKLVWGDASNDRETVVAGDSTGCHHVLASLAEFQKRLTAAQAALQ